MKLIDITKQVVRESLGGAIQNDMRSMVELIQNLMLGGSTAYLSPQDGKKALSEFAKFEKTLRTSLKGSGLIGF